MRTFCQVLSVILLSSSAICLGQDVQPAATALELANPGFEQVRDDSQDREQGLLPAAWMGRSITFPAHRLTEDARSGQRAAQITFTEGEGTSISGYYYSDPQPLTPCKRVTVSAHLKVAMDEAVRNRYSGAFLRLMFLKGDDYVQLHNSTELKDSAGEWRTLELSASPPLEADAWRMSVEFAGIGTALFDDAAAEFEPHDTIPAATRQAPAGELIDLGDGRFGMLGPVAAPAEGLHLTSTLSGRSALPQTIHIGAVWYKGEQQLATVTTPAKAWQTSTAVSVPLSALPAADAFRPIVYAESRAAWDAAEVTPVTVEQIPEQDLPPAELAPAPHPRLFVSPAELARLRELVKLPPEQLREQHPQLAELYTQLISVADKCFDEKEIVVYGERYKTAMPPAVPPRHDDPFPYWTGLSRAIEIRIEAMATAYLLTGEQRYADLAKSWTLALCEWPRWNDPDYPSQPACLDTGHFCHAVAFAYDFLYDVLSEQERKTIADALLEKGAAAVMKTGQDGWARTMSWPNGFAVVMGGMGIAGMATLGDDDRADEYVQYARRRLSVFLDARDRDGGYVEGLVYGGYAMSLIMPFAGTLSLHGDDALVAHPYIEKTLRFVTYCLDPGTATSVNFCDSGYSARAYNSMAAWRARGGDGLAQWYLAHSTGLTKLFTYTPPLAVLWHPLDTVPQAPAGWLPAAHYRDIGWLIMRSGFAGGESDLLFAMRSGYQGSHCQLDQNSFMLNVGGNWLLTDPGYGRRATELHSTLLVDGQGQAAAGGSVEAFGVVGDVVYAAGDASGCYDGLSRFVRHVIMIDKSYFVIFDEVAPADQPVDVRSQLVTGVEEPWVEPGVTVYLDPSGQAGRNVNAPSQSCVVWIDAMGEDVEVIGDKGPRKLVHSYHLDWPSLRQTMLFAGPEESIAGHEITRTKSTSTLRSVQLSMMTDEVIDYVFFNLTGELWVWAPKTDWERGLEPIESDARLVWIRMRAGAVEKMSVVWGSTVKLGDRVLLKADHKQDFHQ